MALLLALQLSLCAVCAAIAWWWRKNHGYARFHLALTDYNQARSALFVLNHTAAAFEC